MVKNNSDNKRYPGKMMRYFGALFMEKKYGAWAVSVGRISWWMAFFPAIYTWAWLNEDIGSNHLTILLILAGYNLGKKAVDQIPGKNKKTKPG